MSQDSCDSYYVDLKPKGILLVDSYFVKDFPTTNTIGIPFTKIAEDVTGKKITANVVALGAICYFCDFVTLESLKKALANRIPPSKQEMNFKALQEGYNSAKRYK